MLHDQRGNRYPEQLMHGTGEILTETPHNDNDGHIILSERMEDRRQNGSIRRFKIIIKETPQRRSDASLPSASRRIAKDAPEFRDRFVHSLNIYVRGQDNYI